MLRIQLAGKTLTYQEQPESSWMIALRNACIVASFQAISNLIGLYATLGFLWICSHLGEICFTTTLTFLLVFLTSLMSSFGIKPPKVVTEETR